MVMDDLGKVRLVVVERLFRNLPGNSHFRCSLSNHDPSSLQNCCTSSCAECALHPKAIHTSRQQPFGDGFGHRLPMATQSISGFCSFEKAPAESRYLPEVFLCKC